MFKPAHIVPTVNTRKEDVARQVKILRLASGTDGGGEVKEVVKRVLGESV
jgi:hypothetical protein